MGKRPNLSDQLAKEWESGLSYITREAEVLFFFSLYGVTFFLCVKVFWSVGFNHTCLFVRVVFLLMFVLKSLNIFCHI